jgi:F-type H+-transporting ATPase subunit a
MTSDIHITIAPETIFQIAGFDITNAMLSAVAVSLALCLFGIISGAMLRKQGTPNKIQNAIEWYYSLIEGNTEDIIGSPKKARPYLGYILSLFLFIVFSSWLGLIPGVLHIGVQVDQHTLFPIFRAPTTDLNATIALSIMAWLTIEYAGFSSQGFAYLGKFFQFKGGFINFLVGIQELISEFARLISFSFRLFGNIFAGEVLIVVILALTKFQFPQNSYLNILNYVGVPLPSIIILMEVLVAMMQAYVFVSLMSVFIALSTESAHH